MSIFSIAETFLLSFFAQLIIGLLGAFFAIILENKYGLFDKATKLWHKIKNSKVELQLLVKYSSNMPFKNITEIILDNLRETYGQPRVIKNNEQKLEVMVNNSFHIIVEPNLNGCLLIQTNKITSHINFINKTVEEIFNIFKDIKRDVGATPYQYNEKCFTVYLYLPFKKTYAKFNAPKGVIIDNYEIKMFHEQHHSEIVLKGHFLKINSKQKDDLLDVIKCFTKVL